MARCVEPGWALWKGSRWKTSAIPWAEPSEKPYNGRYQMWEPIWRLMGRQGMVVKGPQWGKGLAGGPGMSLSTLAASGDCMADHFARGCENARRKEKIRWSWTGVSGRLLSASEVSQVYSWERDCGQGTLCEGGKKDAKNGSDRGSDRSFFI